MKLPLMCTFLILFGSCKSPEGRQAAITEKAANGRGDVPGYQNYRWGTPRLTIFKDLDSAGITYHQERYAWHRIDLTFSGLALSIVTERRFFFDHDSLTTVSIKYDYPIKTQLDTIFSEMLMVETEKHGKPDSIKVSGMVAGYADRTAFWNFKSTKIELSEMWGNAMWVSVTYWSAEYMRKRQAESISSTKDQL